jgi:hypothetical protein
MTKDPEQNSRKNIIATTKQTEVVFQTVKLIRQSPAPQIPRGAPNALPQQPYHAAPTNRQKSTLKRVVKPTKKAMIVAPVLQKNLSVRPAAKQPSLAMVG